MDFVLWKPSKPGEPSWQSPCGIEAPGRPGWHIECSAMAKAHLGQTFDIHGGGIDLVFPHHENEIAQSRCANRTPIMAKVWMHNGFLQVEGEKMAKSAGNFVTVHELLTTSNFGGSNWPGEAIRFAMLKTHYRQPLDWTLVGLNEAHKTLWEWYGDIEGKETAPGVPGPVLDALLDDLNTPKAITELHRLHSGGRWGPSCRARLSRLLRRANNIERTASAAGKASISFHAEAVGDLIIRATPRGRRRISRRRTASAASWKPWGSF